MCVNGMFCYAFIADGKESDAYISYSHAGGQSEEDLNFVVNVLKVELERRGYVVIIRDIDHIPGTSKYILCTRPSPSIQNRFVSQNYKHFLNFQTKPVCTYLNAFFMLIPNIVTKFQNVDISETLVKCLLCCLLRLSHVKC